MKQIGKINLENATSYLPEDREEIFRAVRRIDGGFHHFNKSVVGLLRDWITKIAWEFAKMAATDTHIGSEDVVKGYKYNSSEKEGKSWINIAEEEMSLKKAVEKTQEIISSGIILMEQGMLEESLTLYREALQNYEVLLGSDHPDTCILLNNMGNSLKNLGRPTEAETLFRRAMYGLEVYHGVGHPDTLMVYDNLANALSDMKRFDEAEELYTIALEGRERLLGTSSIYTLMTVQNLAILYERTGKINEGKAMTLRCLDALSDPDSDPTGLECLNNLGIIYIKQGYFDEAELVLKRALVGREKLLGVNNYQTLESAHNLLKLYISRGRPMDEYTRELFERVKAMR